MIGKYVAAAKGSKNMASSGGVAATAKTPHSGMRSEPSSRGITGAGLNNGKSTYVQNNQAGYQATPKPQPSIPTRGDSFGPRDSMPRVRMSDYRKSDFHGLRSDLSQIV